MESGSGPYHRAGPVQLHCESHIVHNSVNQDDSRRSRSSRKPRLAILTWRAQCADTDRLGRGHQEVLLHLSGRQPAHSLHYCHCQPLLHLAHVWTGWGWASCPCLQRQWLLGYGRIRNLQLWGHRHSHACPIQSPWAIIIHQVPRLRNRHAKLTLCRIRRDNRLRIRV